MNLLVFACNLRSEAASLKTLPSFLVSLNEKFHYLGRRLIREQEGDCEYTNRLRTTLHSPNWKLARAISSQRQTLNTVFKRTQEHCGIFTLVNRFKTSKKRRRYASVTCHLRGSFATGLLRTISETSALNTDLDSGDARSPSL